MDFEIVKANREDMEEILELQYLAYQSEAALFGSRDIPPLKETLEEVYKEYVRTKDQKLRYLCVRVLWSPEKV